MHSCDVCYYTFNAWCIVRRASRNRIMANMKNLWNQPRKMREWANLGRNLAPNWIRWRGAMLTSDQVRVDEFKKDIKSSSQFYPWHSLGVVLSLFSVLESYYFLLSKISKSIFFSSFWLIVHSFLSLNFYKL